MDYYCKECGIKNPEQDELDRLWELCHNCRNDLEREWRRSNSLLAFTTYLRYREDWKENAYGVSFTQYLTFVGERGTMNSGGGPQVSGPERVIIDGEVIVDGLVEIDSRVDMQQPVTFTGFYMHLWETFFYGSPTSVTIFGSVSGAGPWTQIGTQTFSADYQDVTIPLIY